MIEELEKDIYRVQKCIDALMSIPQPLEDEYTLVVSHCGHDASLVVAKGSKILEVIELERFFNFKNIDYSDRLKFCPINGKLVHQDLRASSTYINIASTYVKNKYVEKFDRVIFCESNIRMVNKGAVESLDLSKFFESKSGEFFIASHHAAHACGAFYQSPSKKALAFVYDGGSLDGATNVFLLDKDEPMIRHIATTSQMSMVKQYHRLALLLGDIRYNYSRSSFENPGKLMALASLGNVDRSKIDFYKKLIYNDTDKCSQDSVSSDLNDLAHSRYVSVLFEKDDLRRMYKRSFYPWYDVLRAENLDPYLYYGLIDGWWNEYLPNFDMDERERHVNCIQRISGQQAYDMVATFQKAIEEVFLEYIDPFIKEYPDHDICLSGGGALNIILNTVIKEATGRNVYVPPDPSDVGLGIGTMLSYLRPHETVDDPYTGPELLDKDMLGYYLLENVGHNSKSSKYQVVCNIDKKLDVLARCIDSGRIIGIARGRMERGPRALGNRSIICSAIIPEMKDKLNQKVKFREWFRPFAPITKLENVSKYFEWEGESRYMSFCPKVKEEYIQKLKPIVHFDNTARVQTITRDQNEFIYDLLTEIEKTTGIDMIINTSFNVDKKPIINTVKDAFDILKNTQLDGIVVENTLILKKVGRIK